MRLLLNCFLPLLLTGFVTFGQVSEEQLVKQAFDNYKSSILNDKGEEALKYIDTRTIKYYNDILETVKHADSSTLNSMSLLNKITVFSIRHRATNQEILGMDGKGLFVYAIQKGMVGKNSVANNSVGVVVIDKDFAKGQLVVSGKKAPLYFHFYKESREWKLNLTSLFPISIIAFKRMIDESGKNENDFIFTLLESLTGKRPGSEIWKPLQ